MVFSVILVAFLLVGTSAQCEVSTSGRKECGFYGINQSSCAAKGCCWDPVGAEHHLGVPWCFFKSSPPAPGPNSLPMPLPKCVYRGRIELDAIEYYPLADPLNTPNGAYDGRGCHIVGKPGTLIRNGSIYAKDASITFSGNLRLQDLSINEYGAFGGRGGGISLTGSIDLESVSTHNLNIQDANVRWYRGGVSYRSAYPRIANSTVSLDRVSFDGSYGFLSIDTSNVSLCDSDIASSDICTDIKGSTVTLVDSNIGCYEASEGAMAIESSVLNLTRSTIRSNPGGMGGDVLIHNSTVNATCNGGVVIEVNEGNYHSRLSATNSALHFANCSCQHQFPMKSNGVLNIEGGSLVIGDCFQDTSVLV